MKVLPFKIPKPNDDTIIYQEDHEFVFYDKLHQHEEIQLSHIVKGSGTLIVGDSINTYVEGDILIIGSNLPHVFRSEKSDQKSLMLSLFFTKNSFGDNFFLYEELKITHSFFKQSINGFKVVSQKKRLQSFFLTLKEGKKFDRFITLLQMLKILSELEHIPLSSFICQRYYSDIEGKRMSAIMEYTMNNYHNQILLENIASVANMTKNAFCKYFKKRTNKTYFRFLNELRIENASKLLISDNDLSIAEIADKSGFNNISNFNRQFKVFKQVAPSEYRKEKVV